jgi:hypothetical protein
MKRTLWFTVIAFVLGVILPAAVDEPLRVNGVLIYGHVSLTDTGVLIQRAGEGQAEQALLNMPLTPGDTVMTPENGRCELQFDNGTIVRLDRGGELTLANVLTPSLTSHWQITTLELKRGQAYILANCYNGEMFQVITAQAAVRLPQRAKCQMGVVADNATRLRVLSGKVHLRYGPNSKSLADKKIGSGEECRVLSKNKLAYAPYDDVEFLAWNKQVNSDFNELHRGKSVLPKVVYRNGRALAYWAERYSTRYGKWVYNELFGYVWQPADESFAGNRPFFHAEYVWINNKLFLVPQQSWGWIPAYLGAWHFSANSGWIWIPGSARHDTRQYYQSDSLYCFLLSFLRMNLGVWPMLSLLDFNWYILNSGWTLDEVLRWYLLYYASNKDPREEYRHDWYQDLFDRPAPPSAPAEPLLQKAEKNTSPIQLNTNGNQLITKEKTERNSNAAAEFRSWNPDHKWAARFNLQVLFRPQSNEFACPSLGIGSASLNNMQKQELQRGHTESISGTYTPFAAPAAEMNSASTAADTGNSSSVEIAKKDDGKK